VHSIEYTKPHAKKVNKNNITAENNISYIANALKSINIAFDNTFAYDSTPHPTETITKLNNPPKTIDIPINNNSRKSIENEENPISLYVLCNTNFVYNIGKIKRKIKVPKKISNLLSLIGKKKYNPKHTNANTKLTIFVFNFLFIIFKYLITI
jgi:hypothetical protein